MKGTRRVRASARKAAVGAIVAIGFCIMSMPALLGAAGAAELGLTAGSSRIASTVSNELHDLARGGATTGGSSTASSANASGASVLSRFAPLYMAGHSSYTSAQAIAVAQQFSVIAEHAGVLTPFLSVMKAANPGLKIVAYMNGAFDQSAAGNLYPTSWYAHDAKGNRIRSVSFGNWLMAPTTTWGTQIASKCASLIAKSHYDGCFLDTMGLGPLLPGYVTGLPINSATKAVYTPTAWIAAQSANIKAVESANPNAVVVTNGLASGPKYFSAKGPTEPLLASSHIAMSEVWLRVAKNPASAYPSLTAWKQDVDMLVNAESNGWGVLVTIKLWTSATAAQQAAWHKFALASFLLGAGGRCAMSFSTAPTGTALTATTPWDSVGVGTPSGAYSLTNGLYVRLFSHGVAVVNPGNTSVTMTLTRPYQNLNGQVVTTETFPPDSGDVLVG